MMQNEKIGDQSNFHNQQSVLQPPPEEILLAQKKATEDVKTKQQRKKRIMLISIGACICVLLMGLLILASKTRKPINEPIIAPTVTVSPEKTLTEQELERLGEVVDQADPVNDRLQYPPVDMKVKF